MSRDVNRVELVGSIGDEPRVGQTRGGVPVLNLRVHTLERWSGGERLERHDVRVWGDRAAEVAARVRRGMRVRVEGALRTLARDRDGRREFYTEVNAQLVEELAEAAPVVDASARLGLARAR